MSGSCHNQHPDHSGELNKLNRLEGQVNGIKKMIEEGRYCPDIITQLRAIRSAAKSVESNILRRHLEFCVKQAFSSGGDMASEEKLDELMKLFKKLD